MDGGELGKALRQLEFVRQLTGTGAGQSDVIALLRIPEVFINTLPDRVENISQVTIPSRGYYAVQQEAALALRHTCEGVVMEVKKLEALEKMVEYDKRLTYPPKSSFKLLQPGRTFIRERPVHLLSIKTKKTVRIDTDVLALIFSDVLLLVQSQDDSPSLSVCVPPLPLGTGLASAAPVDGSEIDLTITTKAETIQLRTSDRGERDKWVKLVMTPRLALEGTLMATRRERTATMAAPPPPAECTLGISQREVVIDRHMSGGWGFELHREESGFIYCVETPGPAASAGLRDVDCILAVASMPVHGLSVEQLQALLDKHPGDRLPLTVCVALRRCNIRRADDSTLGMQLRGGCPAYVKSVLQHGPAEEAGVKLGDHVWEVNGVDVRHLGMLAVVNAIQEARGSIVTVLTRTTLRQVNVNPDRDGYGLVVSQMAPGQPCFVASVRSDGPAAAAGVFLGDQLWDIGVKRVRNERLDAVRRMLQSGQPLRMVVLSTLRRVTLRAVEPGEFGLDLDGGSPPRVGAVREESAAHMACLRKGDIVWQIHGCDVLEAPAERVRELLVAEPLVLRLLVSLSNNTSHTSQLQ